MSAVLSYIAISDQSYSSILLTHEISLRTLIFINSSYFRILGYLRSLAFCCLFIG
nr:MAG TPA: hypothetical protein [Bacteriophage sp.]